MRTSTMLRVAVCAALLCSVVVVSPPGVAEAVGSGWHWLNPLPRGETLNDVDIAPDNANVAYAVGDFGCVLKSYDGGVNWTLKSPPYPTTIPNLHAVSVVSSSMAWVAGENGYIARTTDGGGSWVQQVSTLTDGDISGIFFLNQWEGWACDVSGRLLSTLDGGTTWTVNQTFPGVYFHSLYFTSDSVGYAVATGGVYKTINGGTTWVNTHTWGSSNARDVAFMPGNPDVGWAVCNDASNTGNSAYRTIDAGATWNPIDIGTGFWYGVSIASDGTVWFGGSNQQANRLAKFADSATPSPVIMNYTADYGSSFPINALDCSSGNAVLAVGGLGTTARTTNGGTSWVLRPTQVDSNLYDVQFLDLRTGYACGSDGVVWKTTSAGVRWTPTNIDAGVLLYALHFRDANTGWAVGQSGRVYKTTNGGANWTLQTSNTTKELTGVHFVDASKGWAIGQDGTIIATTNGGTTWTPSTLGSGYLYDIDFYDTQNGAIVGAAGAVYVTSNGASWAPASQSTGSPNNFLAVDCVGPNAFYVAGEPWVSPVIGTMTMLKTTTDGAGWTTVPPGPSEALSTFAYRGPVYDIQFVDANNGWVAFSSGYVGRTADGGDNWEYTRVTDEMFRSLSAVNASAVWGVGAGGRIMSNYSFSPTTVYRFYRPSTGTHFYTADVNEKHYIINNLSHIYTFEGVGYVYDDYYANQPLYRFFRPSTGTHFFTADESEKNNVIATLGGLFTYEGPVYSISGTPPAGVPYSTVYRFYRPKSGTHFYTADTAERDNVSATLGATYTYEGPVYYLPR
jgi:photosystem II stability/assembly factor-like uncharacterized protein